MQERRVKIVDLVNREGAVSFSTLTKAFPNISEMTLRSDLKYLDQTRQIIRVYGGARSTQMVIGSDAALGARTSRNIEKKRQIAEKAIKLLRPNTSIYLDSGTTTTEMAKILPDEPMLIFSGGLSCIYELARLEKASVYVVGGKLNRSSMSVGGIQSLQEIEKVNFNMAFLGVTGYSSQKGFSCGVDERCELKQAVLKKAEQVVVLMDSQKVGLVNTFMICMPKSIDILISDDELDIAVKKELQANGVTVY